MLISMRIGTAIMLTMAEEELCASIANGKCQASRHAGSRSEATRLCNRSALDITFQGVRAEMGFQKLTGQQMDGSFFHRSVHTGGDMLSDFRLPGIGIVDTKSTRVVNGPLKVRAASRKGKHVPDAYVLMDMSKPAEIIFVGIIDAETFMRNCQELNSRTQIGWSDQWLGLPRSELRHMQCDEEGKWSIFVDPVLFGEPQWREIL